MEKELVKTRDGYSLDVHVFEVKKSTVLLQASQKSIEEISNQ